MWRIRALPRRGRAVAILSVSRIVDRGAIFAGWVGLGMAVVVAMGFELIIAVQSLVFLFAPIGGLLIGFYANARSERRRPWRRVIANALYAGLFTAVSLAILYAGLRLVFVYGDAGYRDGTQGGPLTCTTGPQCTYERYLESGRGPELAAAGVTDARDLRALRAPGAAQRRARPSSAWWRAARWSAACSTAREALGRRPPRAGAATQIAS